MNITETLKQLTQAHGVSGDIARVAETARKLLSAYDASASVTNVGVRGYVYKGAAHTILLDAHLDEIGFAVTEILDNGFLRVIPVGGIDRRVIQAAPVTVYGENGTIAGTVCTMPPHAKTDDTKALAKDGIFIDCGLNKEKLEKLVSVGDRACTNGRFTVLQNGRVSSKAMDNRSGVTAILYAIHLLRERECAYNIEVLFSDTEEVGGQSAQAGAFTSKADEAVIVDVSFAATPADPAHETGVMGKGVMIGVAPSLSRGMFSRMKELAKLHDIPFQTEVMGGRTGTNADHILTQRGGIPSGILSIPCRYMHSPVEVADIADIENTAKLIAEYIAG